MRLSTAKDHSQTELVGGPWARRAWVAGWLLVAAFFLIRAVPGSPLRQANADQTRFHPSVTLTQALAASANNSAPASETSDVRQVGRFLVRPKNIEDVTEDDIILAKDPETGGLAAKPVLQSFRRVSDHLRILNIRNADGTDQTIKTTNEHPFWVPGSGWINAGDLAIGDRVTDTDGLPAELVASTYEPHPEGIPVYNFEVADLHTYFVAASPRAPPVLVHNECGFQRFVSALEAERSVARQGLHIDPRFNGGYKNLADIGTFNPNTLGPKNKKFYTHSLTIDVKDGARDWLLRNRVEPPLGHGANAWNVPAHLVDEFNRDWIIGITATIR